MEFRDLIFGTGAAEDEAVDYPELLLEGYFDPQDMPKRLLSGPHFLVLGPKGSGKSALCEHLRLEASSNSELFITRIELNNLHFDQFPGMVPGDGSKGYYPSAWEWLLILNLFASFAQDQGAHSNSNEDYRRTIKALDAAGFIPRPRLEIDELIRQSTTNKLAIKLPPLQASTEETRSPETANFFSLLDTLRRVCTQFMSDSRHIVILDGLDTMSIVGEIDWQLLTTLMVEVSSLNRKLREHNTPATIAVLCRTDVFGRLPFANINQIRQNRGMEIDWYPRSHQPLHSPLFRLANKKASVHHPKVGNIFERFFPRVHTLRSGMTIAISRYLMERTRHRPRDFLTLMTYLQTAARRNGVLSDAAIDEGVSNYCRQYFVPEIRGEINLLLPRNEAFHAVGLLKLMGGSEFYLRQLQAKAESDARYKELNVPAVVEQLFNCGAIGNIVPGQNELYYDFSYRNPEVDFDPDRRLIIHNAVIKGLNIPRQIVKE